MQIEYLIVSFNPQRGFMLLGTMPASVKICTFGSFNPQRGFMLLGTTLQRIADRVTDAFQSPERIHAFGNLHPPDLMGIVVEVSIPREDSCFWELYEWMKSSNMVFRFNPQRGFMLLGT